MMKTFTKLFALCALCFFTNSVFAKIIYVNAANGAAVTKDGTSWPNAYVNLQDALSDVTLAAGDQIWVAKGVYKPSVILGTGADNRDKTFSLKTGVAIYGGLFGNEAVTDISAITRNFIANETILTGDLNGNDVAGVDATKTDNAYHVLVSALNDNTTILDGFTITAGYADGAGQVDIDVSNAILRYSGAGIFTRRSNAIFSNLLIKGNAVNGSAGQAANGGGIYIGGGAISVSKTSISNNTSTTTATSNGTAGGVFISGYANAYNTTTFTDVIIADNTAKGSGGGVYVNSYATPSFLRGSITNNTAQNTYGGGVAATTYTSPSFTDINFEENVAESRAGAFHSLGNASYKNGVSFTRCSFTKNKVNNGNGGAVYVSNYVNPTFADVTFSENTASVTGGAIFSIGATTDYNTFSLDKATFIKNSSGIGSAGGAIYMSSYNNYTIKNAAFYENIGTASAGAIFLFAGANATGLISNALFYGNQANGATNGGGAIAVSGTPVTIVGATFYANTAVNNGGAINITSSADSKVNIYNSIFLGNTAPNTNDILKGANAVSDIKNSITQGATGTNVNNSANAVNVFLSVDPLSSDFLKLRPVMGNPAIDQGDNSLITASLTTDIAGQARIHNGTVDLGAYENLTTLPIKLLDFTAKIKTSTVQINWITETETNNDYFLLERSVDGVNFSLLTKTYSKGSTGSSYHYTDYRPLVGTSYYKLTQVDNDGTKVSFDPVAVNFSLQNEPSVSVYPNPAKGGKITINLAGNKFTTLELVNLQGQRLQSLSFSIQELEKTIDISSHPSGTYFIRLSDGIEVLSKKIVIP